MDSLHERAQVHGFSLAIVMFPSSYQVETSVPSDYPQARLREIADRLRIPLLDCLPVLRAVHQVKTEAIFYDQCHHTPYGNRLLAGHIKTFLRGVLDVG